jgi:hypothetical protein
MRNILSSINGTWNNASMTEVQNKIIDICRSFLADGNMTQDSKGYFMPTYKALSTIDAMQQDNRNSNLSKRAILIALTTAIATSYSVYNSPNIIATIFVP